MAAIGWVPITGGRIGQCDKPVWMCLRFTLSYRDVEDLLAERSIEVSYETIRRWANAFGPMIARRLQARRPAPHRRWHLNEMFARIGGKLMYLWRAVDAEGEVLEVLVQARRDAAATRKLMRNRLGHRQVTGLRRGTS